MTSDCVIWTGKTDRDGYGINKGKLAHRVAYVEAGGVLLTGLEIDHLCRNRACVNPDHLEQVTHKENTLRGDTITARNKAVTVCPQGHPYSKENTYVSPSGSRNCRKCGIAANKRYNSKRKQP